MPEERGPESSDEVDDFAVNALVAHDQTIAPAQDVVLVQPEELQHLAETGPDEAGGARAERASGVEADEAGPLDRLAQESPQEPVVISCDLGAGDVSFGRARWRTRQTREARDGEMAEFEFIESQDERLVAGLEQAPDPAEKRPFGQGLSLFGHCRDAFVVREDQRAEPRLLAQGEAFDMDDRIAEVRVALREEVARDLDSESILDEILLLTARENEAASRAPHQIAGRIPVGGWLGSLTLFGRDVAGKAEGTVQQESAEAVRPAEWLEGDTNSRQRRAHAGPFVVVVENGGQDLHRLGRPEGVVDPEAEGRLDTPGHLLVERCAAGDEAAEPPEAVVLEVGEDADELEERPVDRGSARHVLRLHLLEKRPDPFRVLEKPLRRDEADGPFRPECVPEGPDPHRVREKQTKTAASQAVLAEQSGSFPARAGREKRPLGISDELALAARAGGREDEAVWVSRGIRHQAAESQIVPRWSLGPRPGEHPVEVEIVVKAEGRRSPLRELAFQ